jgi:hypothetical protein
MSSKFRSRIRKNAGLPGFARILANAATWKLFLDGYLILKKAFDVARGVQYSENFDTVCHRPIENEILLEASNPPHPGPGQRGVAEFVGAAISGIAASCSKAAATPCEKRTAVFRLLSAK